MLKNIFKVATLAMPICANALVNMVASFFAMLMVGHLGKEALAAAALALTTYISIITLVTTIFYALSILISHYRGQEKSTAAIGELVRNGFWLALVLAIPCHFILWNIDKVLYFFGQDPMLISLTVGYFHIAGFSVFPVLIITVINQFFTGINNPRFLMFVSFITVPLIVLLSYGLILGNFGLPMLGLAGVMGATIIVQSMLCIGMLLYLMLSHRMKKYAIFTGSLLPKFELCKKIFFLGMPIGIQFGGELAAMTIATYFMGYFGVSALAAQQIVSQYSMLSIMIILGLSQALSILISEAYATKNTALIKKYIDSGLILLSVVFSVVILLFSFAPKYLIRPFLDHTDPVNFELVHWAIGLFIVGGITLFIDGIRHLFSGSLRGLHDSKAPMNIGLFCLWIVSLPIGYLCGFTFHGGPIGLRIGLMSGFILATIILWRRIKTKLKTI